MSVGVWLLGADSAPRCCCYPELPHIRYCLVMYSASWGCIVHCSQLSSVNYQSPIAPSPCDAGLLQLPVLVMKISRSSISARCRSRSAPAPCGVGISQLLLRVAQISQLSRGLSTRGMRWWLCWCSIYIALCVWGVVSQGLPFQLLNRWVDGGEGFEEQRRCCFNSDPSLLPPST